MGNEIDKPLSWNERQELAAKKTEEALGENTTKAALEAVADVEKLAEELGELTDWFTEAYDEALLGLNGKYTLDTQLMSAARSQVRREQPNSFARLRQLEKLIGIHNAKHQAVATAAHVSVIEANLKNTSLWA